VVHEYGIRVFLSKRSQVQISAVLIFIAQGMEETLPHPRFEPKLYISDWQNFTKDAKVQNPIQIENGYSWVLDIDSLITKLTNAAKQLQQSYETANNLGQKQIQFQQWEAYRNLKFLDYMLNVSHFLDLQPL